MNIENKVTLRHLRANKKRTLVTIVGAVISAAMITAVATLGFSYMDLMQREEINYSGNWNIAYENITPEQAEKADGEKEVKNVSLFREEGFAALEKSSNSGKPYLYLTGYDPQGFENFNIRLTEGRYPQNGSEIILSDSILYNSGAAIQTGDYLNLSVGQRALLGGVDIENSQEMGPFRQLVTDEAGNSLEILQNCQEKSYRVVGYFEALPTEYNWSPGYTAITGINREVLTQGDKIDAYVVLNHVNHGIYKIGEEIAQKAGIDDDAVKYNNSLLRWYGIFRGGQLGKTIYGFMAMLFAVIIIGSVSLIYNAFAISVSERAKYLGMLASVGATRKQKRNSVLFEGCVIGAVSIPLGVLSGIAGTGIMFMVISPISQRALGVTESLRLVVSPFAVLGAVLLSAVTIGLSVYFPARRASKISAIDAIRQGQDIRIKAKNVKTMRLTGRFFGLEGELGLKNLKRNRGRYFATIFSLIVSVFLFLTVSSFSLYMNKSMEMTTDGVNFDVVVSSYQETSNPEEYENKTSFFRGLEEAEYADERILHYFMPVWTNLDRDMAPDSIVQGQPGEDYYKSIVRLYGLEEDDFAKYLKEAGISSLSGEKDVTQGVFLSTTAFRADGGSRYAEEASLHASVGDVLALFNVEYDDEGEAVERRLLEPLEVAAFTDVCPMGISNKGEAGNITVILPLSGLERIAGEEGVCLIQPSISFTTQEHDALVGELEEKVKRYEKSGTVFIQDLYTYKQRESQMLLLITIFTYGFIVLVSAICVANIFNTISTGIALRKREFAMLRSVGMTQESFRKMIRYESIFYGIKALGYGLPLGTAMSVLMYDRLEGGFLFPFTLPWLSYVLVIVFVFLIVSATMFYSFGKIKGDDIAETLKEENI